MKPYYLLLTITALLFFQSCSIQKKRYATGWNLSFEAILGQQAVKTAVKRTPVRLSPSLTVTVIPDSSLLQTASGTSAEIPFISVQESASSRYQSKIEPTIRKEQDLFITTRKKKSLRQQAEPIERINDRYGIRSFVLITASLVIAVVNIIMFPVLNVLTIIAALCFIFGFINFVKSGRDKKRFGKKVFYNKGFSTVAIVIVFAYFFIACAFLSILMVFLLIGL